jgi:hypothetical protein
LITIIFMISQNRCSAWVKGTTSAKHIAFVPRTLGFKNSIFKSQAELEEEEEAGAENWGEVAGGGPFRS